MTGRRTKTALLSLMAASTVATSLLVAAPVTAATEGPWPVLVGDAPSMGTTAIRVNADVTRQFLTKGVGIIGQAPAGGSQLTNSSLSVELPVTSVTETAEGASIVHGGGIHFTDGDGVAQHSIVLRDITLDLAAETVTATVYAGRFAPSDEYWKNLGTRTVFTLKPGPSGPSSFPYSLIVTAALAKPAAKELGWFPKAGTRLGSGVTDITTVGADFPVGLLTAEGPTARD